VISLKPGIRHRIYFGGHTVTRPPSDVTPDAPQVAEDARRYRDSELAITRLRPYAGAPDSVTKRAWSILWTKVHGIDLAHVNAMIAVRGIIDFCPWTYEFESFWIAEGATFGGYLQRRSSLAVVPSAQYPTVTASTDFAAHLYVWDATTSAWVEDTTLSLGSPTAAYRTPWTTSTPRTGATGGEQAVVAYVPVYRVRIAAQQPSYEPPHAESVTVRVEE